MSIKQFVKELDGKHIEGKLLLTMFISLVASLLASATIYFLFLKNIENFFPKYGIFVFLSIISYALILTLMKQVRVYKNFACMSGMMIGMTLGMASSFLIGFYVGATNGMFWGGMFGILVGLIFGIINGASCGIMGILEGEMAGLMGGLMGAMTAVMMLNDNLIAAAIIVLVICGAILVGLSYMIYEETKERKEDVKVKYWDIILLSFLFTIITTLMIVFGPRSALFQ